MNESVPERRMRRVTRLLRQSRREFLIGIGGAALVTLGAPVVSTASRVGDGLKRSPFASFDREIEQFIRARKVPGGALVVVKDRRLVYAQGYGLADRGQRDRVRPTSLFRIASISKPITAVAVLKLVENGRLSLDGRVWECLDLPNRVPDGKKPDERWKQITIRHLLQHTGGWDRDKSFDPMFRSRAIARELGISSPPGPHDIIRYMLGQPLDFDPGRRYAYSNFGYCLLGRVIEQITGMDYEMFVQKNVLAPIGITRMRIGRSLAEHQVKDEVRYYLPEEEVAESVFDDPMPSARGAHAAGVLGAAARRTPEGVRASDAATRPESPTSPTRNPVGEPPTGAREPRALPEVPWPYGGFCLESMDAHGGWIASAVDLGRFAAAFHDPTRCPLLKLSTIETMHAPPSPPASRKGDGSLEDVYYGCGWMVRPVGKGGKANYWHTGSLPGTYTLLVRRWDGLSWAVLFNQRSSDKSLPDGAIDPALHRAADAVKKWPDENWFPKYSKVHL
jgi:N-acyl-D-amino-acid deacylase